MTRCIAFALFAVVIVAGLAYWAGEQSATYSLPLIRTAAPPCPKLANPCDTIDCNKPSTKEIA